MPPTNQQYPPGYPQQQPNPQLPPPQPGYGQQPPGYPQQPIPAYPAPAAPQKNESPYDFFLESKQAAKRTGASKSGLKLPKILIIAIVLLVIMGVAAVFISSTRGKSDTALGLTPIVSDQQEIIRVSGLGEKTVESPSLKNFAATAESTVTTSQQELSAFITKHGGKVDKNVLAASVNHQTDQTLAAAQASSTYDTAFHTVMQQMLTAYKEKLQQTRDAAVAPSEQAILDDNLASAQLLDQMLSE